MNIEQIKIILNLNIPTKSEPVEFTSTLLQYNRQKQYKLSNYPYFSYSYKYDIDQILKIGNYEKIVYFFFNKSYMIKKINNFKNIKHDDETKYIKHNIEVMLNLLLPTTFPVINNYETSYDKYIKQNKQLFVSNLFDNNDSIFSNAFNYMFSNTQIQNDIYDTHFSFLKIDGKIYTVTKIIWLNDFYNHPIYNEFFKKYNEYKLWSEIEKTKIIKEIYLKIKKIKKISDKFTVKEQESYIKKINESNLHMVDVAMHVRRLKSITQKNTNIIDSLNNLQKDFDDLFDKTKIEIPKTYDKTNYKSFYNNHFYQFIDYIYKINDIIFPKDNFYREKEYNEYNKLISSVPQKFKMYISEVMKTVNNIIILDTIIDKYITDEFIINYDEESDNVKKILETYKFFVIFVNLVKQMTNPIRESSNKELQKIIDKYILDNDKVEIEKIINYISTFENLKPPDSKINIQKIEKYLDTGIHFINFKDIGVPKYEIFLNVDLIEGQLTNTNYKDIYCEYKELYIKNEIDFLISKNTHEASYNRVFMSLTDLQKKHEEKIKHPQDKTKTEKKQKGGNMKTKKKRFEY